MLLDISPNWTLILARPPVAMDRELSRLMACYCFGLPGYCFMLPVTASCCRLLLFFMLIVACNMSFAVVIDLGVRRIGLLRDDQLGEFGGDIDVGAFDRADDEAAGAVGVHRSASGLPELVVEVKDWPFWPCNAFGALNVISGTWAIVVVWPLL